MVYKETERRHKALTTLQNRMENAIALSEQYYKCIADEVKARKVYDSLKNRLEENERKRKNNMIVSLNYVNSVLKVFYDLTTRCPLLLTTQGNILSSITRNIKDKRFGLYNKVNKKWMIEQSTHEVNRLYKDFDDGSLKGVALDSFGKICDSMVTMGINVNSTTMAIMYYLFPKDENSNLIKRMYGDDIFNNHLAKFIGIFCHYLNNSKTTIYSNDTMKKIWVFLLALSDKMRTENTEKIFFLYISFCLSM